MEIVRAVDIACGRFVFDGGELGLPSGLFVVRVDKTWGVRFDLIEFMCIVNVGGELCDTSEIKNLVEEFSSCVLEREVDEISEYESVKLKYSEVLLKDIDGLVEAELVVEGEEPFAV